MPLNPLGVLDLSVVTQQLVTMLENCRDKSPLWTTLGAGGPTFTINITGSAPDSVRDQGDCQLTVYLLHVQSDKYQMNSTVTGPRANRNPPVGQRVPAIPFQPLSLDLYYLVTAYAGRDSVQEQQAMSIVLRCFHEQPFVRKTVVVPVPPNQNVPEEFTLTMEFESVNDLAALWHAITVPLRLSLMYKVSVVLITPPAPPPPAPAPSELRLAVDPGGLPFADLGQLTGTLKPVTFASPHSSTAAPEIVKYNLSPATIAPFQRLFIFGDGLDQTPQVFLIPPGAAEQNISGWKVPEADPANPQFQTKSRITLDVPAPGALPTNSPPAGIYQLRAGNATGYRTNSVPLSLSAGVQVTIASPNPPLLAPAGGTFTFSGVGFIAGDTELLLDTVPLTEGALAPGFFTIGALGTSISFQPPAFLAPGLYSVRVRVGKVESDPSWWIQL
jgi:hypothetical protein